MAATNRITVNLTDSEYAALAELAKRFKVSMAWLCRRAMAELIENYRERPGQMLLPFTSEPEGSEKP